MNEFEIKQHDCESEYADDGEILFLVEHSEWNSNEKNTLFLYRKPLLGDHGFILVGQSSMAFDFITRFALGMVKVLRNTHDGFIVEGLTDRSEAESYLNSRGYYRLANLVKYTSVPTYIPFIK